MTTAPAVVVTLLLDMLTLLPSTGTSLGLLATAVPVFNSKPLPVNTVNACATTVVSFVDIFNLLPVT